MITDKTKKALKDYYMKNHVSNKDMSYISWHQFQELDLAFKWGVYLEFFDSVGIKVIPDYDINKRKWFAWLIDEKNKVKLMTRGNGKNVVYLESRKEAQTEAIRKANELFNQSNR